MLLNRKARVLGAPREPRRASWRRAVLPDRSANDFNAPHWPLQMLQDKGEEGGCPRKLLRIGPLSWDRRRPPPYDGPACPPLSRLWAGFGLMPTNTPISFQHTFHKLHPTSAGLRPSAWLRAWCSAGLSQVEGEPVGLREEEVLGVSVPLGLRALGCLRSLWSNLACCQERPGPDFLGITLAPLAVPAEA